MTECVCVRLKMFSLILTPHSGDEVTDCVAVCRFMHKHLHEFSGLNQSEYLNKLKFGLK